MESGALFEFIKAMWPEQISLLNGATPIDEDCIFFTLDMLVMDKILEIVPKTDVGLVSAALYPFFLAMVEASEIALRDGKTVVTRDDASYDTFFKELVCALGRHPNPKFDWSEAREEFLKSNPDVELPDKPDDGAEEVDLDDD